MKTKTKNPEFRLTVSPEQDALVSKLMKEEDILKPELFKKMLDYYILKNGALIVYQTSTIVEIQQEKEEAESA